MSSIKHAITTKVQNGTFLVNSSHLQVSTYFIYGFFFQVPHCTTQSLKLRGEKIMHKISAEPPLSPFPPLSSDAPKSKRSGKTQPPIRGGGLLKKQPLCRILSASYGLKHPHPQSALQYQPSRYEAHALCTIYYCVPLLGIWQ